MMMMMRVLALALAVCSVLSQQDPLQVYGHTEALEKIDVTGDGGIIRLVVAQGTGPVATKGAQISAHYDGRLADTGKQFDSSRNRGQPFTFALGGGQVIQGWDKGFAGMRVGEKSVLVIKSEYGYGSRGAGGVM
jgi:FKBP-type peptidyl-prolyl cis-trans isomerase